MYLLLCAGGDPVPQDRAVVQAVRRAALLPQPLRLRHARRQGGAGRRHQDQDDARGGRRGQDHPQGDPGCQPPQVLLVRHEIVPG